MGSALIIQIDQNIYSKVYALRKWKNSNIVIPISKSKHRGGLLDTEEFPIQILIVDDCETARFWTEQEVKVILEDLGLPEVSFSGSSTISGAMVLLNTTQFHLVLLDRDLGFDDNGNRIDGTDSIPAIKEIQPNTKVLMLTSSNEYRYAAKAIKMGATAFITKNETDEEIEYRKVQILAAVRSAKYEIDLLKQKYRLGSAAGVGTAYKSSAMQMLEYKLQTLAGVSTPVLFLGESGLGKTHAAERLNRLSAKALGQKERVFVDININEIPGELIEARLFGSEKGSYTGSVGRTQGLFECAKGGDLFLDEIGDASLELQGKLLKVIEKKCFRRVGGNQELRSDARLIFATNKNLEEMVLAKTFRQDLYARICTVTITMPELSDRAEDIPFICETLGDAVSSKTKRIRFVDFPDELKAHFLEGRFPHNIRGLRSDLERLFIFCPQEQDGSVNYRQWKAFLGKPKKKVTVNTGADVNQMIEALAFEISRNKDVCFVEIRDRLEGKTLHQICKDHPTNIARAHALGLSEGNTSTKVRKHLAEIQGSDSANA